MSRFNLNFAPKSDTRSRAAWRPLEELGSPVSSRCSITPRISTSLADDEFAFMDRSSGQTIGEIGKISVKGFKLQEVEIIQIGMAFD